MDRSKSPQFPFVEAGNEYERALVRGEIPQDVYAQIPTTESGAPPSGEEQYLLQLMEQEAMRRAQRGPGQYVFEEIIPDANPNGSPPSVVDMALRGLGQLPPDPIMGPLGMGAASAMGATTALHNIQGSLPNALRAARRNPEMLDPRNIGRGPGLGGEVGAAHDIQALERIDQAGKMRSFENDLQRTMKRLNANPALPPPTGAPNPGVRQAPTSVPTPGTGGDIAEVGVRQAAQRRQQSEAFRRQMKNVSDRDMRQAELTATSRDVKEMADYVGRTGDTDPGTLMNVLDAYVKARVQDGASAAKVRREVAAALDEGGYKIDFSRYQQRNNGKFGSFPERGQNKLIEALRRHRRRKR